MRPVLPSLILLFAVIPPLSAATLQGTCSVAFFASSTLHDFEGEGRCHPFSIEIDDQGRLQATDITVPVAEMTTHNKKRDRKMRETFDAEHFPLITGHLAAAPLATLRDQLHQVAAGDGAFTLTLGIRNRGRTVSARIADLVDSPEKLAFHLTFPVSLKSYGLKPPPVLGFIRVADRVRVEVEVELEPLPTPWQENERKVSAR
ncbi:YceI-like domain-containing protein [Geothermobacter ehrlichii]|uniref:YceI-like domain-containing protein n=1 Tax=Geothermobacter ehrlichii TaxID=213224 RepID=A0A5D3WJJ1_9BACT|nr:YceI family protein [Geothermobacter ehrlichii]TYO99096.1 YceI-like domain-containing protein [Geothermobacter ehrlichii]